MENYKLLQRLGKGSQGAVFLARHRAEGKQYVLKQIECNDESEANKAFAEALALKKLKHPFICGFKELFVHWDKEISAMFVCIVMKHYAKGDLCSMIRKNRENQQAVDELLVKKWLGQIIDALIFIHDKGVVHRDLKPSNIFIQEDNSIAVGDFGVATVMADILTRTRSAVGTLNYMAPEVLEVAHNAKTDVWSVGCIALEMATCQHADITEMAGLLNKIKHDPAALEPALEVVDRSYSADLSQVIRSMLQQDPSQRPEPLNLVNNPYIHECLQLSGATVLEKQKRNRSARKSDRPLPTGQGPAAMIEFITDNLGCESSLRQALEHLRQTTKEDPTGIDADGKRVIAKAMRDYASDEDIQLWGCQIFNNIVISATCNDVMYSSDMIAVIIQALETHSKNSELLQAAASILMALSADEAATERIGALQGVEALLTGMRALKQEVDACTACLGALWSLAVNEDNVRTLTEHKGICDVVAAMTEHGGSPEVQEAACAVLLSLSMEDENLDYINKLNCVGLVLEAMQQHMKEPKLIKNACMALAAMVEPDEESAFRVLTNQYNGQEVAGIPVILKAYECHKDNAEVVENICTLAMELLEYDEINAELKYLHMHDKILLEIHKRFKENKDIMKPCEAALLKLGAGNIPLHQGPRVA